MSFAQIHRAFEGYKLREEGEWRKVRRIAYEIYTGKVKNPVPIDVYMQIGEITTDYNPTQEELDEYWKKYGKLSHGKN